MFSPSMLRLPRGFIPPSRKAKVFSNPPVTPPGGGTTLQLLEDFTLAQRTNGEGDPLFNLYTGEDPGSTFAVVSGSLRCYSNPSPPEPDDNIYMQFFPIVSGSWYPFPGGYAQNYLRSGTWRSTNNRLGFLFRCDMAMTWNTNGGDNIQIGTYSKDHGNADDHQQGRHFYHLLNIATTPNAWMACVLDNHPQHERNHPANYQDNPTLYVSPTLGTWMQNDGPVSYMDGMSRFYFDPQPDGLQGSIWDFDDFYFWERAGEPDYYISSLAYGYTGTRYAVYWSTLRDSTATFEVRYRTDGVSMKSAGFTSGTTGGTTNNSPGDAYVGCRWVGPVASESVNGIYVAIRVTGQTAFREVFIPYQMGPGNTGFAYMAD